MTLLVKKTTATSKATSSIIEIPELEAIPDRTLRKKTRDAIGEYLVEQTLIHLADSSSPVSGAPYKRKLSKEYAEFKKAETGSTDANLDLRGDMISALDFKGESDTEIELGVFGSEAPKADGHNNFSGRSQLPTRQFLPGEGDSYRRQIQAGVDAIIQEAIAESAAPDRNELRKINTSKGLYDYLKDELGLSGTRAEIRRAVALNDALRLMIEEEDLEELL